MIARSSRPPSQRAQRYALFVDSLNHEHEQAVVYGSLAAAREIDAKLVVIAGGPVDAPDKRLSVGNFAFDFVNAENALGILVLSGTLGNVAGPQSLARWLTRFTDLPLCCMGVPIPGHVSVRVDNAAGISEAVRHLVEVHGKRNIGFIRGPAQSDEAEVRYAAYREALLAHGIQPDTRRVAEGDYHRPSGALAVHGILDEKRVSVHALDALVCANDYMALGALDELGRRGINVPEQVALIGFDDVPSAAASRPSLTTVQQPAGELGREGLKQLLRLAGGAPASGDVLLPVELKVRRSCGCTSLDVGLLPRLQTSGISGSFEAALVQRRQVIAAELVRAAHGSFGAAGSNWESPLLSALIEDMREGKQGALSRHVQRLLLKLESGGSDLGAAPLVLSTLRRQALLCVAPHSEARARLEDAISDAQLLATGLLNQVAVTLARSTVSRSRALARQVHEQMFGGPTQVSQALAEHLPGLGVDACVVAAIASQPETSETSENGWLGQVCFGFAPGKGHPIAETMPLSRLITHPLVHGRRTLFLLPITLSDQALGVAVFSVTTHLATGDLLEDLRELFSTVLKVSQMRHG